MNAPISNPENSAVDQSTQPEEDWLTDDMAYELAMACQMAGIPVRLKKKNDDSPEAPFAAPTPTQMPMALEPSIEPVLGAVGREELVEVQQKPEQCDEELLQFNESMRTSKVAMIERLGTKVVAEAGVLDGTVRALFSNEGHMGRGVSNVVMLAGPSGSGKTLLARALAEELTCAGPAIEIDLASLCHRHSSALIDGVEPSYQNAGPGLLTGHVHRHPQCAIIFDNVELAHPTVLQRIAAMLSTGKLSDRFGIGPEGSSFADRRKEVDFSCTRVIFTTRAGEAVYDDPASLKRASGQPGVLEAMLLQHLGSNAAQDGEDDAAPGIPETLLRHLSDRLFVLRHPVQTVLESAMLDAMVEALSSFGSCISDPWRPLPCLGGQRQSLVQALLLSVPGGATMRDVKEGLPSFLMRTIERGVEMCVGFPRYIKVDADPAVAMAIADLQKQVTGKRSLVEEMQRRQQRLQLRFEYSPRGRDLDVTLAAIEVQQVVASPDLTGPAGICTDLPKLAFDDVQGQACAKRRLRALAQLLKMSGVDLEIQDAMPRGLVLHGAPGTGKTMLARALASEADVPFIATVGTDWRHPRSVRQIMAKARKYAPSVVFIDELDAVGRRDDGSGDRDAINLMLSEIDGFNSGASLPVLIVGATNDLGRIEPALLRAGRLDIHIEAPGLERQARLPMLHKALSGAGLQREVPDFLLDLTSGCNGADIERIRREAVCERLLAPEKTLSLPAFMDIALRVIEGESRPEQQEAGLKRVAVHEAGHAIAAKLLLPQWPVSHVSVVRRQKHEGLLRLVHEPTRGMHFTRSSVKAMLQVLLAGRVAEKIALGDDEVESGSASDLEAASRLVVQAIECWGFDEQYGAWSVPSEAPRLLEATRGELVERSRAWIREAEQCVHSLLSWQWGLVDSLTQQLVRQKWVEGAHIGRARCYDQ